MSYPATKDEAAAYAINAIADALKLIAVGGYTQAQDSLRSAIGHLDHAEALATDLMGALEASLERCTCGHVRAAHKETPSSIDALLCTQCTCVHFQTSSA